MIEFRNISKIYNGNKYALSDINLDIEKGEFVFLVGLVVLVNQLL